jgi:hypothetical protein
MRLSNIAIATVTWVAYASAAPAKCVKQLNESNTQLTQGTYSQFAARQSGLKFPYGSEKVRGVNLGGVSRSAVAVLLAMSISSSY